MIAPYTTLPITNPAFSYVPSHQQTPERLAETFRRHAPILVCPINQEKKQ